MDVDGVGADAGYAEERRREIEELKFLVGTSCSRLINLLTDRDAAPDVLGAEAAFIAERAARLAELLEADASGPTEG